TPISLIVTAGVAPCQSLSPGANQTTSPGRISSTGPPSRCAQPQPDVTIKVWPSGWVCQAARAPGSNVTLTLLTRAGSGAWNSGSWRTTPVKYSAGALRDGCEPLRLISMGPFLPSLLKTARHAVTARAILRGGRAQIGKPDFCAKVARSLTKRRRRTAFPRLVHRIGLELSAVTPHVGANRTPIGGPKIVSTKSRP